MHLKPKYAEVVALLNKYRNEKNLELNPDEILSLRDLEKQPMKNSFPPSTWERTPPAATPEKSVSKIKGSVDL